MQPSDDFRNEDAQLREVLEEWRAPQTPASLDERVLAARQPRPPQAWWRFLINGYIRVPVPVACCLAALMMFAAWRSIKAVGPSAPCSIAEQPAVCTSPIPGEC
jgi:hypothetical protein